MQQNSNNSEVILAGEYMIQDRDHLVETNRKASGKARQSDQGQSGGRQQGGNQAGNQQGGQRRKAH